ncbi:MAG: ABC-F family ATP-binding cassette domain-containing protein, partial [Peptococcaceae bacterium]|nr:ABC-F family ATP-binding cassette domain-containing protein [Peptococcaceae bacterium]
MNLLSVENISKSFSEKILLDRICLGINENDRIGLIGVNGTGKSTLLKIIAGLEKADQGERIKGTQVRIEYLSQNPVFDPRATVLEQVLRGNSPVMNLVREYQQALMDPKSTSERIALLSGKMDELDGWTIESEAKNILTKLGSPDFNARMGSLSGGEKKRIALAAALINPSDILILDEPTNHLDNNTIDWLEQYLNKIKGALLMITHDRYFLDRVVNQIIELEQGNLYSYKGNFSYYLEKKAERLEIQSSSENKKQRLLKQELAWIKKGARARTTKQKARIDRYTRLNQEKSEIKEERLTISVGSSRLGGKIIELKQISKAFDQKIILKDFNYFI